MGHLVSATGHFVKASGHLVSSTGQNVTPPGHFVSTTGHCVAYVAIIVGMLGDGPGPCVPCAIAEPAKQAAAATIAGMINFFPFISDLLVRDWSSRLVPFVSLRRFPESQHPRKRPSHLDTTLSLVVPPFICITFIRHALPPAERRPVLFSLCLAA
jgi:hypothetical protein